VAWEAAEATRTAFAEQHGEAAFPEAVTSGQYEDATRIFYGGQEACRTHQRVVERVPKLCRAAEMVVFRHARRKRRRWRARGLLPDQ
jgi:hypothetical protein